MKTENVTLENILDSEEFNEMFDFETEKKELEDDGWKMSEVIEFAKSFK